MTNLDWTLRLRLPAGYNNSISIKPYTYNSNLPLPPASSSSSGVAWPRGSSLSPSRLARALLRDIPLETVDVVHCRFTGWKQSLSSGKHLAPRWKCVNYHVLHVFPESIGAWVASYWEIIIRKRGGLRQFAIGTKNTSIYWSQVATLSGRRNEAMVGTMPFGTLRWDHPVLVLLLAYISQLRRARDSPGKYSLVLSSSTLTSITWQQLARHNFLPILGSAALLDIFPSSRGCWCQTRPDLSLSLDSYEKW